MTPPDGGPEVTVTRPDAAGRPVELLELGPEEPRQLPGWARRVLAAAAVLALLVALGARLLDRWEAKRLADRQDDVVALLPGLSGGGPVAGEVQLAVGVRNDGPRPLRLREPQLEAGPLSGARVVAPERVEAGQEVALVVTLRGQCPPPDLTGVRQVVSVLAVAASGRQERVAVAVPDLPGLLEQACREPLSDDDLVAEVQEPRLAGDVLRLRLDLRVTGGAQAVLTGVGSPLFQVAVATGLAVQLPPGRTAGVQVELRRLDCDSVVPLRGRLPGGITVPVQLQLRRPGDPDSSGAGSGRGPRPDGRDPDQDRTLTVVRRDLALDAGAAGAELARLAQRLAERVCDGPERR